MAREEPAILLVAIVDHTAPPHSILDAGDEGFHQDDGGEVNGNLGECWNYHTPTLHLILQKSNVILQYLIIFILQHHFSSR